MHVYIFSYSFGIDSYKAVLDDIQCSDGDLLNIQQCSYSTDINFECTDRDDVSVTCCKDIKIHYYYTYYHCHYNQ